MIRQFPSLFSVLLLLLVVWAPLPFGSVTMPFRTTLYACIWGVLLVGLWTGPGRRRALIEPGAKRVWLPFSCLVGLAALAWLQSMAVPTTIARWMSPAHVLEGTHAPALEQGVAETAAAAEAPVPVPAATRTYLSWSPDASRLAALAWLTAAAAFLCGALVTGRRERRVVLMGLLASACFQVIYGGPRFRAGDPVIWGVTLSDPSGRLRGTFVNPNHTAFFVALAIPIAAAWLWLVFRYARDGEFGGAWLIWLSVPTFVLLLLLGGVVLTQSRSGLAAVMVVLLFLGLLMFRGRHWGRTALGAVLLFTAMGVLVVRSGEGVLRRFWELQIGADAGSSRLDVYGQVLDLWSRFPVFGSGLGSFRSAFSAHSEASLRGQWWNAHSDWLELAATGGALSLVVLGCALFLVARELWRRRRRPSRQDRATAFAVLGALVAATLHSAVDFGLAMPANQFALALLLGIGVAPRLRSELTPPSSAVDEVTDPETLSD